MFFMHCCHTTGLTFEVVTQIFSVAAWHFNTHVTKYFVLSCEYPRANGASRIFVLHSFYKTHLKTKKIWSHRLLFCNNDVVNYYLGRLFYKLITFQMEMISSLYFDGSFVLQFHVQLSQRLVKSKQLLQVFQQQVYLCNVLISTRGREIPAGSSSLIQTLYFSWSQ